VVGGGIEFAVADSVRLRTEALYYALRPLSVNAIPAPVPYDGDPYTATSRPRGFIIRFGLTADLN
jgi:hypothetical protein